MESPAFQFPLTSPQPSAMRLSDLLSDIRGVLQRAFNGTYWVTAEVSNVHHSAHNGHVYFDLVETDHGVKCAYARGNLWANIASRVLPKFKEVTGGSISIGMQIMLLVKVDMHPQYGISLTIYDINPEYTLGHLERLRQETIKRLQEEGVWGLNKLQTLPFLIQKVAVITSPTAAGWGDFQNQINENKVGALFKLSMFVASMQGNDTTRSIHEAMNAILSSNENFDVLVIIRGGGSKMDLSAFDEYHLCCLIANFPLPVITGIGHERDISVADMVAHTSQKTPTAVAEFLLRNMEEVIRQLHRAEERVTNTLERRNEEQILHLNNLSQRAQVVLKELQQKPLISLETYSNRLSHLLVLMISKQQQCLDYFLFRAHRTADLFKSYFLNLQSYSTRVYSVIKLLKEMSNADKERISYHANHLEYYLTNYPDKLQTQQGQYDKLIKLYDPTNIIKRGFMPILKRGKTIQKTADLSVDDDLTIFLLDGEAVTKVQYIKHDNNE